MPFVKDVGKLKYMPILLFSKHAETVAWCCFSALNDYLSADFEIFCLLITSAQDTFYVAAALSLLCSPVGSSNLGAGFDLCLLFVACERRAVAQN